MGNKTSNPRLYVIGENKYGELGVGQQKFVQHLAINEELPLVTDIKCGHEYNIYIENDENYWFVGDNKAGQCGTGDFAECNTLTKMEYFKENNVKIKKLCTSIGSSCTFYISSKNRLYAHGMNQNTPTCIKDIFGAIDVVSTNHWSVALCAIDVDAIVLHWIKKLPKNPHQTILSITNYFGPSKNLIHDYFGPSKYQIWKTTHSKHNGHNGFKKSWKQIDNLKDKEIIKIKAGYDHCLFLESNGNVYGLGSNEHGELGIGKNICRKYSSKPINITYFAKHKIKIKDIACGLWHNLAIDTKGNLYSWGLNFHGQVDNIVRRTNDYSYEPDVTIPQKVSAFKMSTVKHIGCGGRHSYVCTSFNKHYVFGNNDAHQCIGQHMPCLLNKLFSNSIITNVFLGVDSTIIIVK